MFPSRALFSVHTSIEELSDRDNLTELQLGGIGTHFERHCFIRTLGAAESRKICPDRTKKSQAAPTRGPLAKLVFSVILYSLENRDAESHGLGSVAAAHESRKQASAAIFSAVPISLPG